jgi:ABC-type phosphate transport system substrate-binding protein
MTGRPRAKVARWVRVALAVGILVGPVIAWSSARAVADTDPSTLVGEGGSAFYPVIQALLLGDQSGLAPLFPSYSNVTLNDSIADFVGSAPGDFATDFALSERTLTTTETNLAEANGRTFAYVPFAATPVAIVTLVPTFAAGENTVTASPSDFCDDMPLTVADLGQIFGFDASNPLQFWGGALDATDPNGNPYSCGPNGGATSEPAVSVWANADPTMENESIMALLDSDPTAKSYFDAGLEKAFNATPPYGLTTSDTPSESWPYAQNQIIGGDEPLIGKLLNIDTHTNAPDTAAAEWQLGSVIPMSSVWTGAPLGVNWDLPTAAIQNAQGGFVAPSAASAGAAEGDATLASTSDPTTNNVVTFTANPNDAAAYNNYLMMEEYLVVPTNTLPADKATKLAQFIRFILGTTGQKIITSYGAAPATSAMVTAGLKVAAQLTDLGLSDAAGTTTTTTTANSTTSTTSATSSTAATASQTGSSTTATDDASSGTGNTGSDAGGSTLALTGSNPLPLVGAGAFLVGVAVFGRRRLFRRAAVASGPVSRSPARNVGRTGEESR